MSNQRALLAGSSKLAEPTSEEWEAVRPLVTRLWYDQKQTNGRVIAQLNAERPDLKWSPSVLKRKCQEWGLHKKLNEQDAEDLLASQANAEAMHQRVYHLLRGRNMSKQHVDVYRRRSRHRTRRAGGSEIVSRPHGPPNVIALFHHPIMRPGPSIALLGRFEAVLRETRLLLDRGKQTNLCIPERTSIDWTDSTQCTLTKKREFQSSIWEGTKALEDENYPWAVLCWRSAFLLLEDMLWKPDLDLWTTFIRSCIRLYRYGAARVAQLLLAKLRDLTNSLPLSSPHRPFLEALTNISLEDLVTGGLFFLEAKLRNIELVWPAQEHAFTTYEVELGEERYYHGFENNYGNLVHTEDDKDNDTTGEVLELVRDQTMRIAKHLIVPEYSKAEELTQQCLAKLENMIH